jgi:hypothetical protein
MRSCPFTLLVCLVFSIVYVGMANSASHDYINVNIINPDHISASPVFGSGPTKNGATAFRQAEGPYFRPASAPNFGPGYSPPPPVRLPVTKCKGPVCPPQPMCAPMKSPCIMPIRWPGQWEFAVQVFFAQVRGTFQWPAVVAGVPASEVSFYDVGIKPTATLLEYSARYQIDPRWALFYSIMPIELDGSRTVENSFWYGSWFYPAGTRINTKWTFTYQRVGLMYQPIVSPCATASLFAGWTFNEQKLRLQSEICGGRGSTVNRTRNMVTTGAEFQKCLRTLCGGATFSCDNRGEVVWLDGVFGVDAQTSLRFSVPLGLGRWGYARGGYRYLNLTEDRDDLRLDSTFEGGFVEGGLIF